MKIIKIQSCTGCPYRLEYSAYKMLQFCKKAELCIKTEAIPDWCPLESDNESYVIDGAV